MFWVGVYADRTATLRAVYVARKLRGFPAAYGNTVLGQNDTVPDGILNEVRSIVSCLEYTGVAEFEYRQNPKTGGFSLIEVSPRAWSWIMATKASEANIPLLAYEDLSGNPIPDAIVNENPGRIKSILMFADLLNVFWRYRRDAPEWVMSPRKWWKSLKADKLVAIDVDGFDPLVTLYCAAIAVRNLIRNER